MNTVRDYLARATEADALLDRAFLFLEDGENNRALEYFEKVLDNNARAPFAYLGRMIVALGMRDVGDLALFATSYTEHADFVKTLRFAPDELREALSAIAKQRDAYDEAYRKAKEAEENASTPEELVQVYRLYEAAADFSDAKVRRETVKESISVLVYYSAQGYAALTQIVEASRTYKERAEEQMAQLNTAINMEKQIISDTQLKIARLKAEYGTLGLFKGKRKREIMEEIAEADKKIEECEKNIQRRRRSVASLAAEIAKAAEGIAIEKLFKKGEDIPTGKYETETAVPSIESLGIDLVTYTDEKKPLAILKKAGALAIVSKDIFALYAILTNENTMKVICATKKSAAEVGKSPLLVKVLGFPRVNVEKYENLTAHLPTPYRVAIEAKRGDIITLGYFPKDGIDPYRNIIPLPGTPYQRPGTPVEWTVVKRAGNMLTLICNKVLLQRRFEETCKENTTWRNSELRAYMQGEMLDLLLQGDERELLVPMRGQYGQETCVDSIYLPSYDELRTIHPLLPTNGYIFTRDQIEISTYASSLLVNISVLSLQCKGKWDERWHVLAFNPAGIVPVITIKVPGV